jgi:hypothetical protein
VQESDLFEARGECRNQTWLIGRVQESDLVEAKVECRNPTWLRPRESAGI